MIALSTIVVLLVLHWVADFVLQSDRVAQNKSKSNLVLLEHITIYSLPFILFFGPVFAIVNAIIHGLVDYYTSRLTSKLWADGQVHNFFVVIGFDQLLHISTLVITYNLLF